LLKHVIGEDSYEELISLQDDHSELTSAMQLIAQEYRHNAEQIQKLESGIVENEIPEAEIPPAVAEMNAAIAAQQG
jgi:cell division protein FtsB